MSKNAIDQSRNELWSAVRTLHHSAYPAERIRAERSDSVAVCIPALNEVERIEQVLAALQPLRHDRVVDEIVVIDGGSTDGTPIRASRAGASVYSAPELMSEFGPVLGKGDAMWRALSVLETDLACFVDADSEHIGPHFVCGLIGPLVLEPGVDFVKGFYRRPFQMGDTVIPEGGGRVNELAARPLLDLFYPALAAVRQPLAGEIAARRELLEGLPFATGYAVEIAMLIDVYREVGSEGMAQVDLEVRQNRHQPLSALAPMARAVLGAVAVRLQREGRMRDVDVEPPVERPPLAAVRAADRA